MAQDKIPNVSGDVFSGLGEPLSGDPKSAEAIAAEQDFPTDLDVENADKNAEKQSKEQAKPAKKAAAKGD